MGGKGKRKGKRKRNNVNDFDFVEDARCKIKNYPFHSLNLLFFTLLSFIYFVESSRT